jgi:cephalosporin hydroxylase
VSADDFAEFEEDRRRALAAMAANDTMAAHATGFVAEAAANHYPHGFDWLGLPILQLPQDIVAIQDLIWRIKPRAIVETGIARGGSLALSASILELIGGDGIVIGVDIDIRAHNRRAIEAHPLAHRIELLEGSAIDDHIVEGVTRLVGDREPVLVLLDSMHSHAHVVAELEAYSPLVAAGSYVVVLDTAIEDLPADQFADRPWGPGNSPKSAVHAFLATTDRFEIDTDMDARLQISSAPNGYLRCIR